MADKTLYDILEVSETASTEIIRAAYERMAKIWGPDGARGTDAGAAVRHTAVTEAFLTLANPTKRDAYDRRLHAQRQGPFEPPFWSGPKKVLLTVLIVLGIGAYSHYYRKHEQAKLEAEKAIALEKAKVENARAEAERAQTARQVHDTSAEERQRRQRENDLRAFEQSQRSRERESFYHVEREKAQKVQQQLRDEAQRRRDEQQAAMLAQQRVAREKAELCQIERARYGRAISC